MSKSGALRVSDVRAAFRLIGDCRDVGDDPAEWQEVAMAGLCRLAGAMATVGGEGRWVRSDGRLQPLTSYIVGYDAAARAHQAAYMRENGIGRVRTGYARSSAVAASGKLTGFHVVS